MHTRREALLAMGYKEVKPKRWMKPIGYQLLSYNEDTNDLSNWFKDIKGEIVLWERTSLLSAFEAREITAEHLRAATYAARELLKTMNNVAEAEDEHLLSAWGV